jgi:uncharacterized protein (DUF3820 family)
MARRHTRKDNVKIEDALKNLNPAPLQQERFDTRTNRFEDFINDHFSDGVVRLENREELLQLFKLFEQEEKIRDLEKADIMPVGKYKGKSIKSVASFDRPYILWLLKQDWINKYPAQKEYMQKL